MKNIQSCIHKVKLLCQTLVATVLLVSHLCDICVVLLLHPSHWYHTCVALMLLVLHSRSSSLELLLWNRLHAFFISNTFISNARLKLTKNQANVKQHSEPEVSLFENYSHSLSKLSSRNTRTRSKEEQFVCIENEDET